MIYLSTALNKKYLGYTAVMLTSFCINNKNEDKCVFLLSSELDDEDIKKLDASLSEYNIIIKHIKISRDRFDNRISHNDKWSMEAYYRLMLFDLLPDEVDRLLYLDVDMIINKSVTDFYHRDFGEKSIFVCENAGGRIDTLARISEKQKLMFSKMFESGYRYFNSGMLLMNVKRLRESYNFEVYCKAMEEWNYEMVAPDQDLMNYLHWEQVEYVEPERYNYFSRIAHEDGIRYEDGKEKLCIIHYTDEKPWETKNYHYPIEKIWWDYAKKTEFYPEIVERFIDNTMMDPYVENWIRDLMAQVEKSNQKLGQAIELIEKMQVMMQGGRM